jgi:GNAT superfamily N-acetyltransferase
MLVDVRPVTADRWADVVEAFGRRGADPSWCWCQLFLRAGPQESAESDAGPDNREALHREITHATVPPGLIAYVDSHPAGWTRVGPRSAFPGVSANKALARVLTDEAGVWWVTCFAVDSRHRRSGLGLALLQAAVEFARQHEATAVEGHPVDVDGLRATQVAASALYTGTRAMFAAAGFVEIARTYPTRPVMRLDLANAAGGSRSGADRARGQGRAS